MAGNNIKKFGDIVAIDLIGAQQANIGIQAGCSLIVIPAGKMHVAIDAVIALFAHDQ